MKIYIVNENKRKIVYDILNIFYDQEDFDFVGKKDEAHIKIYESYLSFGQKNYAYEGSAGLKSILYEVLEEFTGYNSPWGMLTGSKPSKLLKNMDLTQIKEKYKVSDEKLRLLSDVRCEQEKFDFPPDAFSLYINIPFCPTRCDYCSYPTLIGPHHDRSAYVTYLLKEIDQIDLPKNLDAVYVGGGTPSFLSGTDIKILLGAINDKFTYKELTFEAGREDTLDKDKLDILKAGGVSRISLNPQTFNRDILTRLNRDIDMDHFLELYTYAKSLGLIVNMDFIIGLVGEDSDLFAKNFDLLEKLLPDNITFHALAIKSGSKYKEANKKGMIDEGIKISRMIGDFTDKYDYKAYYLYRQKNILSNLENVAYQRKNTGQRYNIIINEELSNIIGLGMNANSKLTNGDKYRNSKNLRDYYRDFDENIMAKNQMISKYRKDKNEVR